MPQRKSAERADWRFEPTSSQELPSLPLHFAPRLLIFPTTKPEKPQLPALIPTITAVKIAVQVRPKRSPARPQTAPETEVPGQAGPLRAGAPLTDRGRPQDREQLQHPHALQAPHRYVPRGI